MNVSLQTTPPPRAGRREWVGLAVLALPTLLVGMDLTVLNLAVPHLAADLQPSSAQLLWIVDIYAFLSGGALVTMGTLGDRIGRRRLLLIGSAAFGLASVLAAFSASAGMLIASRALLGVAGATLMPSCLSLARSMFHDPGQRTLAISVVIASLSGGTAIGPLLGGVLLDRFWWGSVFLLGVPVMLVLLAAGPLLLPEYRDPAAGRLDLVSAGLSLAAVLLVIYGLKDIAQDGLGWLPALSILTGLAAGLAFLRRQRRLPDPLMDLRLFGVLAFSASLGTLTLAIFVLHASYLYLAQYLQLVLSLSPLEAGLWTVPSALGVIIGSMLATKIVRRIRPAVIVGVSLLLASAGFVLFTQLNGTSGLAVLVTGSVIVSLGLGPIMTLATTLIIQAAPPQRAGSAAALSETSGVLGGALGIAVLGSVSTAVYRGQVTDNLPAGIPPEATQATQDTLGGAVAAAAQLPDQLGTALVAAAHAAFTQGLHLAAVISAVVMAALAVLATALLRRAQPSPEPDRQPAPEHDDTPAADTEPGTAIDTADAQEQT